MYVCLENLSAHTLTKISLLPHLNHQYSIEVVVPLHQMSVQHPQKPLLHHQLHFQVKFPLHPDAENIYFR